MASVKMGVKRGSGSSVASAGVGKKSVRTVVKANPDAEGAVDALLSTQQLDELVSALKAQKDLLTKNIRSKLAQVAKDEMETGDEMDLAALDEGRMLATQSIDRDTRLLQEIERALDRVEDGSYGICEGTDEAIGYSRLRLNPWTRYSITYQEELEREAKRSYNNR